MLQSGHCNSTLVVAPMPGLEPENMMIEVTGNGHLILNGELRGILKDVKELLLDESLVSVPYNILRRK
jgi:HSP20 family molecular chaperone IbpA